MLNSITPRTLKYRHYSIPFQLKLGLIMVRVIMGRVTMECLVEYENIQS